MLKRKEVNARRPLGRQNASTRLGTKVVFHAILDEMEKLDLQRDEQGLGGRLATFPFNWRYP
jgi:hypothetical protein